MIAAVVLAAGAASRFGSPKQALLLPRVLARVHASAVDEVVVVLGAYEVDTDARTVRCPDWELGPGASLRCGLAALGGGGRGGRGRPGRRPRPRTCSDRPRRRDLARGRRRRPGRELRRRPRSSGAARAGRLEPHPGRGRARPDPGTRPVRRPRLSRRHRHCRGHGEVPRLPRRTLPRGATRRPARSDPSAPSARGYSGVRRDASLDFSAGSIVSTAAWRTNIRSFSSKR